MIHRVLDRLLVALDQPVRAEPPRRSVPLDSAPAVWRPASQRAESISAPPPQEVVPALRTLEEVRADLARLRQATRARHAQAKNQREMSFAPTDLMGIDAQASARTDAPRSGFEPTDFLDFSALDLRPAR